MEVQFVTLSQHLSLTPAAEAPSIRPPPTSPATRIPQPPMSNSTNGSSSIANGPNGDSNGMASGYYFVFTGCHLEESDLKEWLRACAKQVGGYKICVSKITSCILGALRHKSQNCIFL